MIIWLGLAFMFFAIDRITKYYALYYFMAQDYVFTSFFNGTYLLNTGVSFGLLSSDNTVYFWMLTISICFINYFLLTYWFKTNHNINFLSVGLFLINTGSLSNIVDRVAYAGVVDWIDIHYHEYSFPVFNFADVYIFLGALLTLYTYIKE